MDTTVTNHLYRMKLGEMQTFENMAIVPLFSTLHGGPDYSALKEVLEAKQIIITEISQSGSVPYLKVNNALDQLILLLDGEELVGAKQNRVLTTSVLLRPKSETIIPVSCTEQGRWSYRSTSFSHSGALLALDSRLGQARSVAMSLQEGWGHLSDQQEVWADVAGYHERAGTSSSTGALRDVYMAKDDNLKAYVQAFECTPRQQGCLVFIHGKVVGFDIVSRPAAYRVIHPHLIKSYALEAILQPSTQPTEPTREQAVAFLQQTLTCKENRFEGVGLGNDFRYEGAKVVGSALVCDKKAIHMAFFNTEDIR